MGCAKSYSYPWLILMGFFFAAQTANAETPLRYTPGVGKTFVYEVELNVDTTDGNQSRKGEVRLKVDRVTDKQIAFSFSSSLASFRFRSVRFAISPYGELQSFEGECNLPYFLGDFPVLLVDQLSEDGEKSWVRKDRVTLGTKSEYRGRPSFGRGFGYFRSSRFGPGRLTDRTSKTTLANEKMEYRVKSTKGDLVQIERTYLLKSKPDIDGREYEATGTSDWVFNRASGMPESLHLKRKVVVDSNNITIRVPIELTMKRISQAEVDRRAAEAKKRHDELQMARTKPISAKDKKQFITDLQSKDRPRIHRALIELSQKEPSKPDGEIASAAASLKNDRFFNSIAQRVLIAYSPPEVAARIKLNGEYQDRSPVDSTGFKIDADTKLFVGQIVQFNTSPRSSFWFPGTIRQLMDNGNVLVAENGPFDRVKELSRTQIQLAPQEVEQPPRPAKTRRKNTSRQQTANATIRRTWRDVTGTHEIEAELLSYKNGQAKLKRIDNGKILDIEDSKLSKSDREFLKKLAKRQKKKEKVPNPFE